MRPSPRHRTTRDPERSRKEILETAFLEVYNRGFQGVSVDDIVAKTSLTKGAFYHHFPTKLDLGYALVDDVLTSLIVERWIAPLDAYDDPLEGIARQMELLIGHADPAVLRTGCPLNNLVQEMAPIDLGFETRLQRALNVWIDGIDRQLKRGVKAGFVRRDVDTRQAAHFIVLLHEGTYGLLKGLADPGAFRMLFATVKDYLRSLEARPIARRPTARRRTAR
ncbi:MAG: TetR/AcrR family transcriptional regulator [Proteobacteria bacterium]|nr:TetR/AcrR family transcriptional regulator [Pseudomonadota bacterium]